MHIVILPGDGIGPEIAAATRQVLDVLDAKLALGLRLEEHAMGLATLDSHASTLPSDVMAQTRAADGVILAPVSTYDYPPPEQGGINPSAHIRIALDLYANVRPSRTRAGVHNGVVQKALRKLVPRSASQSKCGVRISTALCPGIVSARC